MELPAISFFINHIFLFALPASSIWFMWGIVICMLFIAFRFFRSRLQSATNRIVALQEELNGLHDQLEYVAARENIAKMEAEKFSKAKNKMLSSLSHEIRTPMNGVLGMATLLEETDLNREQREYTDTIINSGQALLNKVNEILISDILDLSKIDAFASEPEQKNVDLVNCVEEVLEMFAVKAAEAETELLYEIDNDVPLQIISDYKRLQQILINLVENAVKFTKKGEVFLKVSLEGNEIPPLLTISFDISDTGIGIPDDMKAILFTGALPANYSTKNKTGSKGLGLVICRKLAEQMGGDIRSASNENAGARFTFSIRTCASTQSTHSNLSAVTTGFEEQQVLIINHNLTAANILSRRLERWKLLPIVALSQKQAMEILSQVSVSLIIIDLVNSDNEGIGVSEFARNQYPEIPQLIVSSVNDDRYKQHGEFSGATQKKPMKQHLLFDNIMSQLRHGNKSSSAANLTTKKIAENFSQDFPLRIIVAEDNTVNQKWIKKILGKMGYHPAIADNGKIVLEMVGHEQYDLILMDVQMPEMDGLEATKMIRLCLDKQPVIIAMTANVMHGDRQACIQAGMDDYISKPVELPALVNMLQKWALVIKERN